MLSIGAIIGMTVGAVLTSYILTSLVLFKFPNLIHKKKKLKFRCNHISHRGGAGENLENTLTAFHHAEQLGTDMLEIDVHLTRDEQIVVSHDQHLFRVAGWKQNISELNFSELPLLTTSMPIDFERSKCYEASSNADRQIPLLKNVFEEFPKMPINIDIKTNNDLLIRKVSELIKEYDRESFTVWGNVSNVITTKCYKENPNIPLLFSARSVVFLALKMYSGLLPFLPLRESCLEIFMPSLILTSDPNGLKFSTPIRLAAWLMDKLLMRKCLFDHLSKRGVQTYLWVLNKEDDYEKAFRLGATGVMTDYPTKLRDFLDKNPQYRNQSV
ncbi:hypothetical protein CHUAL_005663 [Chamberlinius hualienensis]